MYGEIAGGRIKAIDKLQALVDKGNKEKTIQSLLADHLWLLDTSWERATAGDLVVEKSIRNAWEKEIDMKDLKAGRIDIAYRIVSGIHVIVELKRATVTLSFDELHNQVKKYIAAFKAAKKLQNDPDARCEVRVILGKEVAGWKGDKDLEREERNMLAQKSVQVCYYDQLTAAARKAYSEYIEKQNKVSKIREILSEIESS
jgi:hypothetical protein